jgi:hypothetical protein
MSEQEQRHFHRIPFDAEVTVLGSRRGQQWKLQLLDISLKGAMIVKPDDWQGEEGEAFHLDIRLDGAESSVKLAMDASVAHIEEDRIGFKCENMDLDTATHLHRLVELNLGDETLLERDLAELIGVKPA